MMLKSLLLNGISLFPLYAPEGEGAAAEGGDAQLPLDDAGGRTGGDTSGEAAEGEQGSGDGADAGAAADDPAAAAAAEADKVAKAADDAKKAATAKRRANAPKWAMDEISTLREKLRQEREEKENLRKVAERSGGEGAAGAGTGTGAGTGAAGSAAVAPARSQFSSKEEFDRAVDTAAQQREFARATQDIFDAGIAAFEDFQESLNIMAAVGATSDDFAADLVAVDKANAHKIIHELAQTPELSKRLSAMSSRQRVAELTKMSLKMTESGKGAVRQVSRAAAPLRALEGSSGTDENDFGDRVPDDVWSARFDKKYGLNGTRQ